MSHLSLLIASPARNLLGSGLAHTDRPFDRAEAAVFSDSPPTIRSDEASRPDDWALPAGIVSMEHWLDLNA